MADAITQNIVPKLKEYYETAILLKNKSPSMVELVNVAVTMVKGEDVPGEQKFLAVKNAVVETINSLNIKDEEKEKMIRATFLLDDMIETSVTLLKSNKQANTIFNSIISCLGCTSKLEIKYRDSN